MPGILGKPLTITPSTSITRLVSLIIWSKTFLLRCEKEYAVSALLQTTNRKTRALDGSGGTRIRRLWLRRCLGEPHSRNRPDEQRSSLLYFEDKVDQFFTVIQYCNEHLKLDLELDSATLTAEDFGPPLPNCTASRCCVHSSSPGYSQRSEPRSTCLPQPSSANHLPPLPGRSKPG